MAPKKLSASDIILSLPATIPSIFDQAQVSTANHRKNCVALHKLHDQAASVTQGARDGETVKLTGERAFSDVFVDMVNRVLTVKKGPAAAERVVRFIGAYVKFITEKASSELLKSGSALSAAPVEEDEDTATSRFVARLMTYLLKGFTAKDKTVRFRAVSITGELISHLGELDEDLYSRLRSSLMDRSRDKESTIRAHAVMALSKLLSGEDPDELQKGKMSIMDVMLESLCYDSSAEVRRIALLHTSLLPDTLPSLLTRTRDVDITVRTLLYAHTLLPSAMESSASTSGASRQIVTHPNKLNSPKQLTIEQREKVVKDGLGDREDKVRAGAGKMLAAWYDWAANSAQGDEGAIGSLIAFLKLFDVVSEGGDLVAVDALKSVFVARPDVSESIVFKDEYWRELTPESALLARAFIEHNASESQSHESRLEAASLPVVTAFAFYVQEACNAIFDGMEALEEFKLLQDGDEDVDEEEKEKLESDVVDQVFVLGEVLRIAVKLDYSDEIGRRKVFKVVRDMLAHELFPESLMDLCLDVLKETTPSEREIIRIIVEIINELRDTTESDSGADSFGSRPPDVSMDSSQDQNRSRISGRQKAPAEMTSEERAEADAIDARCLGLCISTLKRVNSSFDENSTLEGVLADLIIPAVKRRELVLRERGLVSLGLCCLIAKNMAMSSFQLFLNQVQTASEELKLKVLQVIFDILMVYDEELLRRSDDIADRIITFLLQTLEVEESNAVQALLCIGISKLMLNGLVADERVLTSLVLAYVSPITADNQELRQCLAYFLPIYCYSLPTNQTRMQSIFLTAFDLVSKVYEELEGDQKMITPIQFGTLFVDWTNPQKAAPSDVTGIPSRDVHVDLAVDIVKALYDKDRSDNDIKVFCQLLVKLYLPDKPDPLSLLMLHTLLEHQSEDMEDPATAKILTRFKSRFKKQFGKQIEHIDTRKYASEEGYQDVCELIGLDMPEPADHGEMHDDEEGEVDQPQEDEEEREEVDSENGLNGTRVAGVEDAEGEEDEEGSVRSRSAPASRSPSQSPTPTTSARSRTETRKSSLPNPAPSSDVESDNESAPAESPPATPKRNHKRQTSKRIRSPVKSPSMPSPAHKRVNKMQSPK